MPAQWQARGCICPVQVSEAYASLPDPLTYKDHSMTYLAKDSTMALNGNDNGRYRLAKDGAYNVQEFGPRMTLEQAQAYQADMALANVHVLVVRLNAQ